MLWPSAMRSGYRKSPDSPILVLPYFVLALALFPRCVNSQLWCVHLRVVIPAFVLMGFRYESAPSTLIPSVSVRCSSSFSLTSPPTSPSGVRGSGAPVQDQPMAVATIPFRVETPVLPRESTPVRLRWIGGTPPYNISVGTTTEHILAQFPSLTDTSVTWIANASAETLLSVFGVDADGTNATSRRFQIWQDVPLPSIVHDAGSHKMTALSGGAIAGITAAVAAVCFALLVLLAWTRYRRRRKDGSCKRDNGTPSHSL